MVDGRLVGGLVVGRFNKTRVKLTFAKSFLKHLLNQQVGDTPMLLAISIDDDVNDNHNFSSQLIYP